jgi:adenylate cyclase
MTGKQPTVLVVDDVPENIAILASALADGYRVRAATSGEKALVICRSADPPSLVLLDVVMPGMDGYETCRQLKRDPRTADIPVIFVTAAGAQDEEARGFAFGGCDYVTKPVSVELVRHRVRSQLELRSAQARIVDLNHRLARYLPSQLAQTLESGSVWAEPRTRRRKLTVFFSDIVAFTQHTELLAPEDMAALLNTYFEQMTAIAERHGGTLDKYMGDGMMVFFGDPESRGDVADAQACVQMALEMQGAMAGLRAAWRSQGVHDPLRVRMGVATDYCNVGSFGSKLRLDYTVIGRPVNLAARLQAATRPDTVLVSPTTRALLDGKFRFVSTEPLVLKGLAAPMTCFEAYPFRDDAVRTWSAAGCDVRVAPADMTREQRNDLAGVLRRLVVELEAGAAPTSAPGADFLVRETP